MRMRAAVYTAPNVPLTVEELEIAPPQRGEVLVRLAASGVCHSDYHAFCGEWTSPARLVLGHEGAGVVEQVGEGVESLSPGDHVILSWAPYCGRCYYCVQGRQVLCETMARTAAVHLMLDGTSRLTQDGETAYAFAGVGSFGELAVVAESAAIPISKQMPLETAALIGCAVPTGWGAATRCARVEAGASALVIGCGGVGLSAIMGAVQAGASPVIAMDLLDAKLEQARSLGATHTINPTGRSRAETLQAVRDLTGGRGPQYAFEAIGLTSTIELMYEAIQPGGTAVVVGQVPEGHTISIDPYVMSDREKVLKGTNYGSVRPAIDFPILVNQYLEGRLPLDRLVSRRIKLDEINAAWDAMLNGEVVRSVIVY